MIQKAESISSSNEIPSRETAILWLGSVLTYDGIKFYKGESTATSNWSKGLIDGILYHNFDVTCFAPIIDTTFPIGKLFPNRKEFLYQKIQQKLVPYINIKWLREITLEWSLRKILRNHLRLEKREIVIITYNPRTYFCNATKAIKQEYPNVQWINIVLDLDDPSKDNWKSFIDSTKGADGAIFLSWWGYSHAPVLNKLHLDAGFEGIFPEMDQIQSKERIIYAGKLSHLDDIDKIAEIIQDNPQWDVDFEFYGKGKSESLEALSKNDNRVKIKGYVSDEDLDKACKTATAFISPRDTSNGDNKMIFPSKLFYYLKYRKPIITPNIPGLSPEYNDVFIFVQDNTKNNWTRTISEVLCYSEEQKQKIADKSKELLLEKTWISQAQRLLTFADGLK